MQEVNKIDILGMGVVKISLSSIIQYQIIFQKGIGMSTIQNIFELYKDEIIEKEEGKSFIPLEDFSAFISYFKGGEHEIVLIIYLDDREDSQKFPKLYIHSKKIINCYHSNNFEELLETCNDLIEIPKAEGLLSLFVIDMGGCPIFTKIMGKDTKFIQNEIHIGGFISALFSFSKNIIGADKGANLKEINFGNQIFHTIVKNEVIFAFLVNKMTPLLQRYIYIVADEFTKKFDKELKDFNGEIGKFYNFEDTLKIYFDL